MRYALCPIYPIPYTLHPVPYSYIVPCTLGVGGNASDAGAAEDADAQEEDQEEPAEDGSDDEEDGAQGEADLGTESEDELPCLEMLSRKKRAKSAFVKEMIRTHKPLKGETQDEFADRCMVMFQRGADDQSRLRSASKGRETAKEEAYAMEVSLT